jgi:hypothetical protein
VADSGTRATRAATDWLAEHVGEDAAPVLAVRPTVERTDVANTDAGLEESAPLPVDEASPDDGAPDAVPSDGDAAARRARRLLGLGVAGTAVGIVAVLTIFGGGPPPAPHPARRTVLPMTSAPAVSPTVVVPQQDQAVPFVAATVSCTPTAASGQQSVARSPQALSDTVDDSAWVCGRGPQESLLDGQVLHVRFTCGEAQPQSACSYIVNSLMVVPGWVAKTTGGVDEWLQHRVVRTVQFNFFNGNQLAGDPVFLDTHDVHGPVTATLPATVLASRVDVLVLHTERPPTGPTAPPSSNAPGDGDPAVPGRTADTVLGRPPAQPGADASAEPPPDADAAAVDATFAMSELQIFGHRPT